MKRTVIIAALALSLGLAATALAEEGAAEGKALYTAKCQSCHGADGSKSLMSKPVKGLKADAVVKAMEGYKAKTYGGAKKATMENLAARLSDAEIKALAAYIGTL
ncbi:c-type cytochrome [Humidesulfovibrio idahonensis]